MADGAPSTKPRPWTLPFKVASDIEPEETRFLWQPYVPFGAITLLAGKGGVGKSTIICDIAAKLSTGRRLPGQITPLPPMKVLIVSAEDDLSHKIVPNLIQFQANMDNIGLSDETFTLDDPHVGGIERAMADFSATVVFLDPIVAYLGPAMDMNKSNETRDFMSKLNRIARGKDKAVVVAAHTRKNVGKYPSIDDVLGSVDFGNAIRSGILVYEYDGVRYFKHDKANWSAKGPMWTYTLDNGLTWSEAGDMVGRVNTRPRTVDKAIDFLMGALFSGPLPQKEVVLRGKLLGISEAAIIRAKTGLVKSTRTKEGWLWSLSLQEDPDVEGTFLMQQHRQGSQGVQDVQPRTPIALTLNTLPLNKFETGKPPAPTGMDPKIAALLAQAREKLEGKDYE